MCVKSLSKSALNKECINIKHVFVHYRVSKDFFIDLHCIRY